MPKRPDPNHPLAQSATEFANELNQQIVPDPPAPATEPAPAAVTQSTTEDQNVAPPAPEAPAAPDKLQAMFDTMMGRVEVLNETNRKLQEDLAAQLKNNEFLAEKLKSRQTEEEALRARLRQLEAETEQLAALKGFQSDKVDPEQFAEVFRGIQPHLAKRDAMIAEANERALRAEQAAREALAAAEQKLARMKQEILERNVVRGAPEIKTLLKRTDFQDFLAQRIPGSRRTRLQELQEAYAEADEEYIVNLVADFKKLGNLTPAPNPSDPPRAVTTQTPRAPVKQVEVTDEMLQAAFQKYLNGDITQAEYKQLRAAHKKGATG